MAAVMLQVIPGFYKIYSKNSLFISANTYEKFIVSKEYCIAGHDDKMCFLPNCRYHIILIGNIKELLQNCMHSVSTTNTWTACIRFSSTASMENCYQDWTVLWFFTEGSSFQPAKQRSGEKAEHREKETLEEKVQNTFVELLPKD